MRTFGFMMCGLCLCLFALPGQGQQPRDDGRDSRSRSSVVDNIVQRMMAFDKNKDGKLTREEISDSRLLRTFDRADADKDGVVTREELVTLATTMVEEQPPDDRGPPDGPPGPPGGGPGGPGGRGGMPRPGTVLPSFLQDALKLTSDQKQQLAQLQKEVDERLAKILTADQLKQLRQMRPPMGRGGPGGPGGSNGGRGPGGPGGQDDGGRGPGGPGGRRGQGGPPPDGPGNQN